MLHGAKRRHTVKHKDMAQKDTAKKTLSVSEAENYLKGYTLNKKLIYAERYEAEFGGAGEDLELLGDIPLARAKMFEIRHFIMELENSDEKLMLYYHYVKGEPVERCSELLGISRSSAFRLKSRALSLAQERLSAVNKQ